MMALRLWKYYTTEGVILAEGTRCEPRGICDSLWHEISRICFVLSL